MNLSDKTLPKFSTHNDLWSVARTTHRRHGPARCHRVQQQGTHGSIILVVLKMGVVHWKIAGFNIWFQKTWVNFFGSKIYGFQYMGLEDGSHILRKIEKNIPCSSEALQIFWLSKTIAVTQWTPCQASAASAEIWSASGQEIGALLSLGTSKKHHSL